MTLNTKEKDTDVPSVTVNETLPCAPAVPSDVHATAITIVLVVKTTEISLFPMASTQAGSTIPSDAVFT